ncbi:MAG: hypothetical protein H0X11_07320 [Betaproteobacteria bacterium]|nr:hypothetical protein [Betaproteobacteria bacterium]
MSKIVFWIVLIFVLLFAWRMWNVAKARARDARNKNPAVSPEKMVKCAACGVFLPVADAKQLADGFRCADSACALKKP